MGADQYDILVAGFEGFHLFQRGVEGAAGGVDAVLEPGERLVALLEGIGAPVEVPRAVSEELVPQGTLDRVEAAKVPFAHDDLVEEATRLGGSGRMAGVVFVPKFLEIFLEFPHEDLGFSEDAGLEVGVDDASLTFGGGGAVGLGSVLTGGGDLLLSAHKGTSLAGLETFVRKSKGQPGRDCPFDNYCSRRTLPGRGRRP